jgi:hypothetical protein
MAKVNWQEHFKTSIKNAEDLYSKDSSEVSLLLFCLRSKLIPVQTYLDWAKENYQLPVLSEKFFQTHKPQQEFYKKWQKIYSWSAECLPIAEWDGVLIIGCLQIPTDYKDTNPRVFILTSHEVLFTTWNIYQKNNIQKSPAASEADFADMTALSATLISTPENPHFVGANGELILQEDAPSDEFPAERPEEELELSGNSEGEKVSLDGLFQNPPELNKDQTNLTKTIPILLQPMNTEVTKKIQMEIPKASVINTATPKKGPRSVQSLSTVSLESDIEKTTVDSVDAFEEPSAPPPHLPSTPEKLKSSSPTTAAYLLEKIRKRGQDQFDKQTLTSFHQLKTFFKKSMLLAVGDKDRLVKPILWDHDGLETQASLNQEYNLKTPSIFKIVSDTQKPYHGYVVINDLNEAFFEAWNHGQIPDHVTIVPIVEGDLVVGMLMSIGEKSCYNKNVLQFTEKVAKELSQKIFKNSAPNPKNQKVA